MCVKELSSVEMNSDVSLEIPSGTVIAYSVLELQVQKDGHYGERVWTNEAERRESLLHKRHFSVLV